MPAKKTALLIGITGSVACGKSAAVEQLAKLGLRVVKIDDIVHRFLKAPNPVYDLLVARYGRGIIGENGSITRSELAKHVFASSESRAEFDSLFYPHVFSQLDEELADKRDVETIVESAMLFEWGLDKKFDEIWTVVCSRRQQLARHMARNGITAEESHRIMTSQWSQSRKAASATRIILNTRDLDFLFHETESALMAARQKAITK